MQLTLAFLSGRFCTQPKSQDKNVNISRMKKIQVLSLYWFAAQKQANTTRRQE